MAGRKSDFTLTKLDDLFSTQEDETTYEVENKAGVGFINTAMKGNLKIVKTSSDGKVEGFTFRVTGVNGYDRSFTTDKNGEIIIEGLRIGDYTISEVQDSVSASYVLPADKIATVKVGSTTVVPSRGCRPLFARGWAAAASNACSPRRFSAIERRALDRSRTAGYHDGIAYHFNDCGGNGCAQRIPQAPIFFLRMV